MPQRSSDPVRRLMLVHAHPDDESSQTGATMAKAVAEGDAVTLVTCTLGEEGEIVVPELAHLGVTGQDTLGTHRLIELAAAMSVLGVSDHVRLGGDGRFRDSGMATDDEGRVVPTDHAADDCFWRTDLLTAADELIPLIRDRRPHVLITYNQFGGYGHPDHIQAHRVAMYASQLAAAAGYRPDLGPVWQVPRILWSTWSESSFRERIRQARAQGLDDFFGGVDPEGPLPPMITPDEFIAVEVDGSAYLDAKVAALAAHASQVDMDDPFWASLTAHRTWASEHFMLASGTAFPARDEQTSSLHDLYAGIDLG